MSVKQALSVYLWKFGTTNFKATYRRFDGKGGWTKDYFQVPDDVKDKLNFTLGYRANGDVDIGAVDDVDVDGGVAFEGGGEDGMPSENAVEFEWHWPSNGVMAANYYNKRDKSGDVRGQIKVKRGGGLRIRPFMPGSPEDKWAAIIGTETARDVDEAEALLNQVTVSEIRPWYMAVALEGETNVLHARMILENPPEGRESFGLERQPEAVRRAIMGAKTDCCLFIDLAVKPRVPAILKSIQDALRRSPNVLLVGPPGCGKSVAMEDASAHFSETAWFDADRYDPWILDSKKVYETAFHPAFSYENFVAGLAPISGDGIVLGVRSGPLMNMAQWCRGSDREALLVIDEFNRGPAAAIFGDALVLLDKDKRSGDGRGAHIAQPHFDHDINVPSEFASRAGATNVPKKFSLPHGLKILGAFNSTDRSVAPLDAALMRRFSLVRVSPDAMVLATHLGIIDFTSEDVAYQSNPTSQWTTSDVKRLAVHLLLRLNERIRPMLGEDHEIGHALFWNIPNNASPHETASALACEFEEKVIGRLRQTLRDKDEYLAIILNAPERGEEEDACGVATWVTDSGRVGRLVGAKLHIANIKDMAYEEQIRRLLVVAASA